MTHQYVLSATRQWVESFVIGLNLCPFAKKELVQNRIRFSITEATSEVDLLVSLKKELEILEGDKAIETTLLIHPGALDAFTDYNQFLGLVDELLVSLELEGVFQVASFHPDYQFAGTHPDDPENFTNRSPYPTLHIIREESLERAIEQYPDVGHIPERNIELMNQMGVEKLSAMLKSMYLAE